MTGGTTDFGSIYGPAGGQAVATRASTMPQGAFKGGMPLPLSLAALIALGLMAWYVLEKWD